MNRIHRKVEYALIALKHMHTRAQGQLSTARDIAQLYGAPYEFTARVLQSLSQSGILAAEMGARGGYRLNRDLLSLSLYELMESVTGPLELAECLHSVDADCSLRSTCNIVSPIRDLNQRLSQFYRELSVADLLATPEAPKPSEVSYRNPAKAAHL